MGNPKSSMGSRRVVETSAVVWMDLLGYGSMLRDAGFDPTEEIAQTAVERLNSFQDCVADHSSKLMPSVVMNDGAIIYRDLSPRSRSVTYDFLTSAWRLHNEINRNEQQKGYPGIRSVIAAGFRVRRKSNRSDHLINGIGEHLLKQSESGEISVKQAIYTALNIRSTFDLTSELQANFAFTKAYLAESSGTKGGFIGPNMFVDHAFLSSPPPDWLELGNKVDWKTDGMESSFYPIVDIDAGMAGRCNHEGILDAFEVAENISESERIIKRLKGLTVNGNLESNG